MGCGIACATSLLKRVPLSAKDQHGEEGGHQQKGQQGGGGPHEELADFLVSIGGGLLSCEGMGPGPKLLFSLPFFFGFVKALSRGVAAAG